MTSLENRTKSWPDLAHDVHAACAAILITLSGTRIAGTKPPFNPARARQSRRDAEAN